MVNQIEKLPNGLLPLGARILWFYGVPTLFAVVLLAYELYEAPKNREVMISMTTTMRQHEIQEEDRVNQLIRATNYESAILRAICLAIVPANKSEQARCQPLFTKELDLNSSPAQ